MSALPTSTAALSHYPRRRARVRYANSSEWFHVLSVDAIRAIEHQVPYFCQTPPTQSTMSITIYHNPSCGTSRNTLDAIRQRGEEPEVIEYLKTPFSRERLVELIAAMGIPVRDVLRKKGTPYDELGLDDPKWTDDQLIDFMISHPILINRPIVVTPKGVRLCRPSEMVLEILPEA
jgi:arsenate reductase